MASGAVAYDATHQVVLKGVVRVSDFRCPVGPGQTRHHLTMESDHGLVLIHLAPAKIMHDQGNLILNQ